MCWKKPLIYHIFRQSVLEKNVISMDLHIENELSTSNKITGGFNKLL